MQVGEQRQLMLQALQQSRDYGLELSQSCTVISQCLQHGQHQQAVQLLQSFLGGIGTLSQALYLTSPLQEEKEISIDLQQLSQVLDPLVQALENQDYGLVGDILLYEIQPILNQWSQALAQAVEEGTDPSWPSN